MIFTQKGTTTIITQEKVSIVEMVKKLDVIYSRYQNDNIIINLNVLKPIKATELSEFLKLSKNHVASKHSFVIVHNNVNIDEVSETLTVVPTLQEAHDIIEMEEIERDLGI